LAFLEDIFVSEDTAASAEQAIRPLLQEEAGGDLAAIVIDCPLQGSLFPPEIVAPTFLWHDPEKSAESWLISVSFSSSPHRIYCLTRGVRVPGEIDPRTVTETNVFRESDYQAAAKGWTPDARVWALIKQYSTEGDAQVTVAGVNAAGKRRLVSRGSVSLRTSQDPVGAPIFYRDVPLMPAATKEGIVKPLRDEALPLIKWRLRDISKPSAPTVMEALPTCANCHSFAHDGQSLAIDIDGPSGDKGAHAVKAVARRMVIDKEDVFSWNSFKGPAGEESFGLFPQVSPDGRYVVATVHESVYVRNYRDYTFLQVFYPTRGILAFYTKATGKIMPLAGADDRQYVQTNPVWSPDGKTLLFLRAAARSPKSDGPPAEYANDPRETQMQFDIYRIPFDDGRGGTPEPVPGASRNNMSNSFPKFSPDGKWLVWVQAKNGLLMRPDSTLWIMPAAGGTPRRMSCNTTRMNSWHSWSPNSRWLVFSSKCNTPYTEMFLTHVDENGHDSPAILIPNSTAANRAVNIPEFANIPWDGIADITTPAVDYRRHWERSKELLGKGLIREALAALQTSLDLKPDYPETLNTYGYAMAELGRMDEAVKYYKKALDSDPRYYPAYVNLGVALSRQGNLGGAVECYRKALAIYSKSDSAHYNLGIALSRMGRADEALAHFRTTVELNPQHVEALNNIGVVLMQQGNAPAAAEYFRKAVAANGAFSPAHLNWGAASIQMGLVSQGIEHYRQALARDPRNASAYNALARVLATARDSTQRNGQEAVRLAEMACTLTRRANPVFLDTLACAYAEAGRFDDAVRTAEMALEASRAAPSGAVADALRAHLDLFKKRLPLHQ
jgi:tetratricopeptide (TPR) repeat protein/Tol biopolymer transport system component